LGYLKVQRLNFQEHSGNTDSRRALLRTPILVDSRIAPRTLEIGLSVYGSFELLRVGFGSGKSEKKGT